MAVNDPLRRHQIAQRLERLRAERDHPERRASRVSQARGHPNGSDGGPPVPDDLADLIQAAAEQLLAERAASGHRPDVATDPPPPERVARGRPAPGHVVRGQAVGGRELWTPASWEREWWRDGAATDRARGVFLGDDAWILAWVLHLGTGLPLAVVEERLAGARNRVWLHRHAVVETPDGRYLDITGVHDRAALLARHASPHGARSRVARLPSDVGYAGLRSRVQGRSGAASGGGWQDALATASPEVVELLARELARQHGPARSRVFEPGTGRRGGPPRPRR